PRSSGASPPTPEVPAATASRRLACPPAAWRCATPNTPKTRSCTSPATHGQPSGKPCATADSSETAEAAFAQGSRGFLQPVFRHSRPGTHEAGLGQEACPSSREANVPLLNG